MKGMEVEEKRSGEAFGKVLSKMGVEVKVEDISRIGGQRKKGEEMWLVKLRSENQKREVMVRKKMLKGRKEKFMDDLTWKERKVKWKLKQIAKREKGRGRRV